MFLFRFPPEFAVRDIGQCRSNGQGVGMPLGRRHKHQQMHSIYIRTEHTQTRNSETHCSLQRSWRTIATLSECNTYRHNQSKHFKPTHSWMSISNTICRHLLSRSPSSTQFSRTHTHNLLNIIAHVFPQTNGLHSASHNIHSNTWLKPQIFIGCQFAFENIVLLFREFNQWHRWDQWVFVARISVCEIRLWGWCSRFLFTNTF